MTIDNTWLSTLKEESDCAFTDQITFKPSAVFSDGQIRLMQSPPMQPQTWDEYVFKRFSSYYKHLLKNAHTLIIAFDNYQFVPISKSMTQNSRRKHIPTVTFHESNPLPCMVPCGEAWMQHMANRTFKNKLIDMLTFRLPGLLLSQHPTKCIIIDYEKPIIYRMSDGEMVSETIDDIPALGEADVKFTRWANKFGKLLVDSIDGDSIPIALMNHERLLQQETDPPQVSIYRYKINLEKPVRETGNKEKQPRKRAPKEYEYVHIPTLYLCIQDGIRQCLGKMTAPFHKGHEVRMVIALIGLTGTDFNRHLPQLSGKTLWENLVFLWAGLMVAYDPLSQQLRVPAALQHVVCKIYQLKFHKILGPIPALTYSKAYEILQSNPKLAARTKASLAPEPQITTTILNVNWVLQYWTCEPPPNPISEQFGYKADHNNKVSYMDS